MNWIRSMLVVLLGVVLVGAPGCGKKDDGKKGGTKKDEKKGRDKKGDEKKDGSKAKGGTPDGDVKVNRAMLAVFGKLPETGRIDIEGKPATNAQIDLGRMLYYDARLSKNHDISCNSCHMLDKWGTDNLATSPGHRMQRGGRSSPTVYHAAGHVKQFWDGRAKDVEEQALGPIMNPIEMAMPSEEAVLKVINSMPEYVEAFEKAFEGETKAVTYQNIGRAIGAFERGLVTPSPFDKFLAGDDNALTNEQKKGLNTFMATSCFTCHIGPHLGGSMFRKLGEQKPWPNLKDEGQAGPTKNPALKYFFKVPSLRNIAKTGPYFHDGSVKDLGEAVRLMARHQLNKELSDEDVASIVAFLESLTGELPMEYIKKPELPKSTADTPKPDPS